MQPLSHALEYLDPLSVNNVWKQEECWVQWTRVLGTTTNDHRIQPSRVPGTYKMPHWTMLWTAHHVWTQSFLNPKGFYKLKDNKDNYYKEKIIWLYTTRLLFNLYGLPNWTLILLVLLERKYWIISFVLRGVCCLLEPGVVCHRPLLLDQ